MKAPSLLSSSLALALSSAEAQPLQSPVSYDSEAFSPDILELNKAVPQALLDLQQCVRERFAVFGLENADGSTSYMFNRPHGNGDLTYDFVFPENLDTGITYMGRYKQLPMELFQGQVVVAEDPNFNHAFDYPITAETLLNNGYISAPEDFAEHFQSQLNRWNNLCWTGELNPIDLPAAADQFWNDALELHASVRSELEQCLSSDIPPDSFTHLNQVIDRFGDLEAFPQLGLEDPYEMTFELELAKTQHCPDSDT